MRSFIKKLFSKKEKESIEVKKKDLESWFSNEVDFLKKRADQQLQVFKQDFLSALKTIDPALVALEKADLRNPNISSREKNYMEGNRKSYAQRTRQLVKQLHLFSEESFEDIFVPFQEAIANYAKASSRSHRILQEFFSHEVRNVGLRIKRLSEIVEAMKTDDYILKHKESQHVLRKIQQFYTFEANKKRITEEREKLLLKLEDVQKQKEASKKEYNLFLESKEYKDFLEKSKELENLFHKVQVHEEKFLSHFSPLKRALRKYEHQALEHTKLIQQYLEDSLLTLTKDTEFILLHILERMQDKLSSLNLKNPEKAKHALSLFTKDFLNEFLLTLHGLRKDIQDLEKELQSHPSKEQKKKLEDHTEKLDKQIETITLQTKTTNHSGENIDLFSFIPEIEQLTDKKINLIQVLLVLQAFL